MLKGGPIRERLLDVVTGLRTPTKVSDIADTADCDTETARDYLEWFDDMGMVHRHDGRPVRYERNDAYFQWRRIDRIREEYSEQELVEGLSDAIEQLETYRTQFDAENPDDVSLVEASRDMATEDAWEALPTGRRSNAERHSLTRRAVTTQSLAAGLAPSIPDDGSPSRGPVDFGSVNRIAAHLARSARFDAVQSRPASAPNAVVADYDLGYLLGGVTRAYLRIRWFETDDFSIHYAEQYLNGNSWESRWDRHSNDHNTREHFHPPPDASTPGKDEDYPDAWRDVLATVLNGLDDRV